MHSHNSLFNQSTKFVLASSSLHLTAVQAGPSCFRDLSYNMHAYLHSSHLTLPCLFVWLLWTPPSAACMPACHQWNVLINKQKQSPTQSSFNSNNRRRQTVAIVALIQGTTISKFNSYTISQFPAHTYKRHCQQPYATSIAACFSMKLPWPKKPGVVLYPQWPAMTEIDGFLFISHPSPPFTSNL